MTSAKGALEISKINKDAQPLNPISLKVLVAAAEDLIYRAAGVGLKETYLDAPPNMERSHLMNHLMDNGFQVKVVDSQYILIEWRYDSLTFLSDALDRFYTGKHQGESPERSVAENPQSE